MVQCKRCDCKSFIKNGFVRGIQRYRCKGCGLNFVDGDARVKASTVVKRALCVILYALGKASFNMLGKILGHSPSIVYRWIKQEMAAVTEPVIPNTIKEMEFDEMWHFVGSKKTNCGSSRQWIVAQGELLHGLSAVVMLQPSEDSTKKLNI